MSQYWDRALLKGALSRSSYDLSREFIGIDYHNRYGHYIDLQYPRKECIYNDLSRQKQGISSTVRPIKRYPIQKPITSLQKSSLLSTQISQNKQFCFHSSLFEDKKYYRLSSNQSDTSLVYPYTFSEYSIMKSKIQQKRQAEEKWLQSQIQRIKTENLLYNSRNQKKNQQDFKYSTHKNNQTSTSLLKIEQKLKNKRILNELKQSKFQNPPYKCQKPKKFQQTLLKPNYLQQSKNAHVFSKNDLIHQKQFQKINQNTFIFDDLKSQNSQFEEQVSKQNQKQTKSPNIQRPYNYRIKEYQKKSKQKSLIKYDNQQSFLIKGEQKNDQKLSISQQKKQIKSKRKIYSELIIFKSEENLQQQKSSIQKSQTSIDNSVNSQILSQQFQEMNIQKDRGQHYPVFTPFKHHKHLPLHLNQQPFYQADANKAKKHLRAWEQKKQNEIKNNRNLKSIIVDELQKKKILYKSHDHHTFIERTAFYEHRRDEQNLMQQLQETKNPESHLTTSHPFSLSQGSQTVVNNLRIDLQILKQQLDDKNRKVVDLEIQLLQLKSSIQLAQIQKKTHQYSSQTQFENPEKQALPKKLQDVSIQTTKVNKSLRFQKEVQHQTILSNQKCNKIQKQLEIQRRLRKKYQEKLKIQQEAMENFLEDIGIYQQKNLKLQQKIKNFQEKYKQDKLSCHD